MPGTLDRAGVVRFGPFRLDMANRLLSRGEVELPLPPRAMGVLWLLVARAGRVVSRQDLLDEVWKDAFVSDTSLAEAVSLVRQVLGDDSQKPEYIQTLPRRGYRFVSPVTVDDDDLLLTRHTSAVAGQPEEERLWTPWLPYLLLFVAGLGIGLAVMARARPAPTPPRGIVRLAIDLAGGTVEPTGRPLAVSRRGDRVALAVRDSSGVTALQVRSLADASLTTIADSQGAASPFFSPDGRSLAFFARGRLWRVPLSGGVPSPIADAAMPLGGTWIADGTIVFASRWTGGLDAVPASGGEPRQVTRPDRALGEIRHSWPDGIDATGRILFAMAYAPLESVGGRIASLDLRSGEIRRLEAHATDARALPFEHMLLVAPGETAIVPVDPRWQLVTGSLLALPDRVRVDPTSGAAAVAISTTGVRIALDDAGSVPGPLWLRLSDGTLHAGPTGLDGLEEVTLTRDGRRAAGVERHGSRADLWIVDLARGVRNRAAAAVRLTSPAWSPDGSILAYAASDGGTFRVDVVRADGGRAARTAYSHAGRSAFPPAGPRMERGS